MGLDAHVFCNCWQEGKTTPPPIYSELIYTDGDGYLDIKFPDGISQGDKMNLWEMLDRWKADCCTHPNLYFCNERIGNWSSVRELQEAILKKSGKYPFLASILPSDNGGSIDSQTARLALDDLEMFCRSISYYFHIKTIHLTIAQNAFLPGSCLQHDLKKSSLCFAGF